MKFTSEDLMKAMGLSVGDRVRVKYETLDDQQVYETYEIKQCENRIYLENDDYQECMEFLVDTDYEILPRPKRVGELTCNSLECSNCPLKMLCRISEVSHFYKCNLYEALDDLLKNDVQPDIFDQEIHDLLKARLDKEVE